MARAKKVAKSTHPHTLRGTRSGRPNASRGVGVKFRPSLFWDVNPKNIDVKKHAYYIIERILDFGTDEEVRWMARTYPRSLIKKVVDTSRVVHSKSKSLWTLVYR